MKERLVTDFPWCIYSSNSNVLVQTNRAVLEQHGTNQLSMATIHDIPCPECGSTASVVKDGIDAYRCAECEVRFTIEDIVER